jgi:hypothetical protein
MNIPMPDYLNDLAKRDLRRAGYIAREKIKTLQDMIREQYKEHYTESSLANLVHISKNEMLVFDKEFRVFATVASQGQEVEGRNIFYYLGLYIDALSIAAHGPSFNQHQFRRRKNI